MDLTPWAHCARSGSDLHRYRRHPGRGRGALPCPFNAVSGTAQRGALVGAGEGACPGAVLKGPGRAQPSGGRPCPFSGRHQALLSCDGRLQNDWWVIQRDWLIFQNNWVAIQKDWVVIDNKPRTSVRACPNLVILLV